MTGKYFLLSQFQLPLNILSTSVKVMNNIYTLKTEIIELLLRLFLKLSLLPGQLSFFISRHRFREFQDRLIWRHQSSQLTGMRKVLIELHWSAGRRGRSCRINGLLAGPI